MYLTPRTSSLFYGFSAAVFMWITLAAWALSSPIGASPDEDFHQTMLYCAAGKTDNCLPTGVRHGHCFTMTPNLSASCENYTILVEPKATQFSNSHYPPLYFKTMSLLVGDTLSATTIAVRLANVTLTILFALGSISLSHAIYRPTIALSWVIGSMPLGMYFLSSLNPSAWMIISIAALWGPVLTLLNFGIFESHNKVISKQSLLRILFVAISAALGLGSRSEAMFLIPLMLTTLFIYSALEHSKFKRKYFSLFNLSIVLVIIFILAFVFITYGLPKLTTFLPNGHSITELIANYFQKISWLMVQNVFNILIGMFGMPGVPGSGLGTHDVPVPAMGFIFIGYALAGCIFISLTEPKRKKIIALVFLSVSIIIIISFLWTLHDWDVLQPRYFLPIFYLYLGLMILPCNGYVLGSKIQWLSILISLIIANAVVLLSLVLRFLHGIVYQKTRFPLTPNAPDINPSRVFTDSLPNWWWIDLSLRPSDLWLIGSIGFALGIWLFWKWLQSANLVFDQINTSNLKYLNDINSTRPR